MIRGRDIIMFGLQPWDIEIGSNFKNMAVEMARHNRILYVNYPVDRISLYKFRQDAKIKDRLNSIKHGIGVLNEVRPNIFMLNPRVIVESINWIPSTKVYNFFNFKNSKKFAAEINEASKSLGLKQPLLIIDNDFLKGFYLPELINHAGFIYYIRDYLLSQNYFKKHGNTLEKLMIKKADAVICNSVYLKDYAARHNNCSYYIGQGCDVDAFFEAPAKLPEDIVKDKPIIGYCGALLSSRLDIELIAAIAVSKPDWNIVLVGPEDEDFKNSKLHGFKNIQFLGAKPPQELAGYIHSFDVCINPQVVNQLTIGNYPRKIDEYLAAGKPVVATLTDTMKSFEPFVYLCNNKNEYIKAIEKALLEDDLLKINERKSFAKGHTWEACVHKLYNIIEIVDKHKIKSYA